ncbi:MAG TPA: DUF6338 family protein [Acidobacteriaceae bacterium]
MPSKLEALGVLFVLLPGFGCAYFVQALAVRRKQTDLDKIIEALVFSFIIYIATLHFSGHVLPVSWLSVPNSDQHQIVVNLRYLLVLSGAAVVLAVLLAVNINFDLLNRFFRLINVSELTARSSVWNDVFQEIGGYVQVGLTDGRTALGWLRYYSDDPEECSIFLEDAAWVDKDGIEKPIIGPGILLAKGSDIEYVIFLEWEERTEGAVSSTEETTA